MPKGKNHYKGGPKEVLEPLPKNVFEKGRGWPFLKGIVIKIGNCEKPFQFPEKCPKPFEKVNPC